MPIILITDSAVTIVVGKAIMTTVENMMEGILAYIGVFYLMDFDYPSMFEIGLTTLHYLFFNDQNIPADILPTFTAAMNDYKLYKGEE